MKSPTLGWLSTVLALATLVLLPNVSVSSPVFILITATLIWIIFSLCWPVLKVFLLPFNLATFGLVGSVAYFILFWFCLWIFPDISLQPVRIFGFYLGDIAVLSLTALLLSLLQRFFSWLLWRFLHKKRR